MQKTLKDSWAWEIKRLKHLEMEHKWSLLTGAELLSHFPCPYPFLPLFILTPSALGNKQVCWRTSGRTRTQSFIALLNTCTQVTSYVGPSRRPCWETREANAPKTAGRSHSNGGGEGRAEEGPWTFLHDEAWRCAWEEEVPTLELGIKGENSSPLISSSFPTPALPIFQ